MASRGGLVACCLVGLAAECRPHQVASLVEVAVLDVRTDANIVVVYRVTNRSPAEVVLLSPALPTRIYDGQSCSLVLSCEVKGSPGDYSFEPQLIRVSAGSSDDVTVVLRTSEFPKGECREWSVSVTSSFLTIEDAEGLQLGTEQNSRQYVSDRERLSRSPVFSLPIRVPPSPGHR